MRKTALGALFPRKLLRHDAWSGDATPKRYPSRTSPTMPSPTDALSLLVAVEFVAMASFVLLVAPLEVAAPLVPLLLVFLVAIHLSRS